MNIFDPFTEPGALKKIFFFRSQSLHNLPSLCPKRRFLCSLRFTISNPERPGWGRPGLKMADLSERVNGVQNEREIIVQPQN